MDEATDELEAPEQNPHGNSPGEQGSAVPLSWKPTVAEPVPVVQCVQIKSNGDRCQSWSRRGLTKCFAHSGRGKLANVEKYREDRLEAARLRLLDDTELAMDTLEFLMQPGTGEAIRLKASTEILDRAGVRGGFEIKVDADITESPADEIRKRLSDLAKGAEASRELAAKAQAADPDIVDAEIVSTDDDQQPSLFDMPEPDDEA